jgi:hypothetical protein
LKPRRNSSRKHLSASFKSKDLILPPFLVEFGVRSIIKSAPLDLAPVIDDPIFDRPVEKLPLWKFFSLDPRPLSC